MQVILCETDVQNSQSLGFLLAESRTPNHKLEFRAVDILTQVCVTPEFQVSFQHGFLKVLNSTSLKYRFPLGLGMRKALPRASLLCQHMRDTIFSSNLFIPRDILSSIPHLEAPSALGLGDWAGRQELSLCQVQHALWSQDYFSHLTAPCVFLHPGPCVNLFNDLLITAFIHHALIEK